MIPHNSSGGRLQELIFATFYWAEIDFAFFLQKKIASLMIFQPNLNIKLINFSVHFLKKTQVIGFRRKPVVNIFESTYIFIPGAAKSSVRKTSSFVTYGYTLESRLVEFPFLDRDEKISIDCYSGIAISM